MPAPRLPACAGDGMWLLQERVQHDWHAEPMPELPEVETVARQLRPLLEGSTVRRLEVLDPRLQLAPAVAKRAMGCVVRTVSRIGKQVVLELVPAGGAGQRVWVIVHLGMTGRLLWDSGAGLTAERRHLRARLHLDAGTVWFVDPRRFGRLRISAGGDRPAPTGIDPLSPAFTRAALARLLAQSDQAIKVWLMRQDRLVGVGNIYASEILFATGVHPARPARSLSEDEVTRLARETRRILRAAIRNSGTTFSTFQDSRGQDGSHQHFLAVYGRQGDACRHCGEPIVRVVQQGRSTFFCPRCQAMVFAAPSGYL